MSAGVHNRNPSTDDEGPEEEPDSARTHKRRESALHVFQQAGGINQFLLNEEELRKSKSSISSPPSLSVVPEEGSSSASSKSPSPMAGAKSPTSSSAPRPAAINTERPSSPKVFIHAMPTNSSPVVATIPVSASSSASPRNQASQSTSSSGVASPRAAGMRRSSKDDGVQKTKCAVNGCMSFAVRGRFCLVHVFRQSLASVPQISYPEQHDIARKIVDTERDYFTHLQLVTHYYVGRLKSAIEMGKPIISQSDIEQIFSNIEEVKKLSGTLYGDLQEIYMQRVLVTQAPLTLLHFSPQFRCYQTYLENYDEALQRLRVLRAENPEFAFFLDLNEKVEGIKLEDLLTAPIKRIPKYLTFLEEMLKKCVMPEQTTLVEDIKSCGRKIKRIADSINASLSKKESLEKVKELSNKFEKDANYQDLVAPNRLLIHMGPLRFRKTGGLLSSDKEYQIFLFTDVLVYASRSGKKYKMKQVIPLKGMRVDPVPGPKNKNTDILVTMDKTEINGSHQLTLDCSDMGQRQEWLSLLDKCIKAYEKSEKTLEVHAFDDKKKVVKSAKLQAMLAGPGGAM